MKRDPHPSVDDRIEYLSQLGKKVVGHVEKIGGDGTMVVRREGAPGRLPWHDYVRRSEILRVLG